MTPDTPEAEVDILDPVWGEDIDAAAPATANDLEITAPRRRVPSSSTQAARAAARARMQARIDKLSGITLLPLESPDGFANDGSGDYPQIDLQDVQAHLASTEPPPEEDLSSIAAPALSPASIRRVLPTFFALRDRLSAWRGRKS